MSNLIVEIGNTALKAAWTDGGMLGKVYRYQGEKYMEYVLALVEKEKPDVMVVASVRDFSQKWVDILGRECTKLIILDSVHKKICDFYHLPEYLSYDRVASIVAVRRLFKGKKCSVFDFGTILKVDLTDEEGNYCGGYLMPGYMTRFKSVSRYSKSLPTGNAYVGKQKAAITVEESIENGIDSGMIFEIEGYMNLYPQNTVIFTGGDADYFANKMKNSIFVVSNLVLMGLSDIANNYVGQ